MQKFFRINKALKDKWIIQLFGEKCTFFDFCKEFANGNEKSIDNIHNNKKKN